MSEAVGPGSPEPLLEPPDHLSLSMAVVLLVLSAINDALGPVELTDARHLSLAPLSVVALSVEPGVRPMAVEEIGVEIALIVLQKLDPPVMLNHEILIFSHRFGRVLGRHPFVILLQLLIQLMLIDVLLLHEILDLQDLLRGIFLLVLEGQLALLLLSLLLVRLADEERQGALALLLVVLKVAIVGGQFEFLEAFAVLLAVFELTSVLVDVLAVFYFEEALA